MAKIEVLSGDFLQGTGEYRHGTFRLKTVFNSAGVDVKASAFKSLEIASESPVANRDALGYGLAGAMLLGPVGALAGYLIAGTENAVTFIGTFKDGRQLMAATDSATYKDISQHLLH